jgi:hypothetical protein
MAIVVPGTHAIIRCEREICIDVLVRKAREQVHFHRGGRPGAESQEPYPFNSPAIVHSGREATVASPTPKPWTASDKPGENSLQPAPCRLSNLCNVSNFRTAGGAGTASALWLRGSACALHTVHVVIEGRIAFVKGEIVRKTLALAISVCVFSMSAIAWTAGQSARPASLSATTIDEVLQAVRSDLQSGRADIVAKNVTLTGEQAARFWPVFDAYQKEQNAIMDEQLRGIQRFIEDFEGLDDAGALGLINAHLDRDARMSALRKKWLAEFQKAVGTKVAVRVMQIDRRLSLAHQMEFAARIPLAH